MNYLLLLIVFCANTLFCVPNLVLIGPPGAGKGTFSERLIQMCGYQHICPGNIVRKEIRTGSELGNSIKATVEQGNYIDEVIIFAIFKKAINDCVAANKPFIIDGFPRSDATTDFLVALFQEVGIPSSQILVIHFQCDDAVCAERIQGRIICPFCDAVYNAVSKPPLKEAQCDQCGHGLECRLGDSNVNVIKRLAYYHEKIEPTVQRIASYGYTVINFDSKKYAFELLLQKITES